MKSKHLLPAGGNIALTTNEENFSVDGIKMTSDLEFPFTGDDIRLLVKQYLDRIGTQIFRFKNNYPGED